MSRIKYLVTGIDNATLGSIIGTLAMGELEGPADTSGLANITTLFWDVKLKETAASRETVELRGKLSIFPTPTKAIA